MNDNDTMKQNWTSNSIPNKSTKLSMKIFLGISLILICMLASLLIWSQLFSVNQKLCNKNLCTTRECIQIASTILERIDQSIDPCEDFYQFACGNFIKFSSIPDDYYAKNLLQEVQERTFVQMKEYLESAPNADDEYEMQQIKRLYLSCINETDDDLISNRSLLSLFNLIVELIGAEWPILTDQNYTDQQMSLEQKLALLFLHQVQPFFQVVVAQNKNVSQYALHMLAGNSVMEQYNFCAQKKCDNITTEQKDLYLNFQKGFVNAFQEIKKEIDFDHFKTNKELEKMFQFEMDLVAISKEMSIDNSNCTDNENEFDTSCDRLYGQSIFSNVSLEEMEKEFHAFKWKTFLGYIFKESNITATHALIHSKEYFHSLLNLIESHSSQTVDNYLGWCLMVKYMPFLGQHFRHLSSEFQEKISADDSVENNGFKYYQSKWKQCVYISCESLKIPAITLYFRKQQQNIQKLSDKIQFLLEEMKSSLKNIIDKQMWIETTGVKEILKDRVETITSKVGIPEHVLNRTNIIEMYSPLDIDLQANLIENMFKINRHETILTVQKLKYKTDNVEDWLFQPLETNAYYDSSVNHIIIPVGIMREPLVHLNIPKYLDLAFFGIVVGHEVAHSIDRTSRKFIMEKHPLLGNSTFPKLYKLKTQCFADQYSSFSINDIEENLNGNSTLDENICDFASFQQAHALYQALEDQDKMPLPGLDHFTIDQVFYLQYAQLWCESITKEGHLKSVKDIHSPGRFRTNGVLMNSNSFAKVFNCPVGSTMHPTNKCDLWAN